MLIDKNKKDNSIFNIDDEFVMIDESGKVQKSAKADWKGSANKFLDRIQDGLAAVQNLSQTQRLSVGILVMIFMIFVCGYYLVFIPRDAVTTFLFGTSKLDGVDCYRAEISIDENRRFSEKEVAALKSTDAKDTSIPIAWTKTIDKSGEIEYITTQASYKFGDGEGGMSVESFSDGINQYKLEEDKYVAVDKEDGNAPDFLMSSFDLSRLLHVSDATLESAKFKKGWSDLKVGISGEEATAMLQELLAIDTENNRIENGVVVYVFNKRTKELENIKVKELELYDAKAKEGSEPKALINLVLTISDIDNVKPRDVAIPDEDDDDVEILMENPDDDKKMKREKVTLSVADMEKKGLTCYTVGTDFGAGDYTIKYKKGTGIVMGVSGKTGAKKFRVCAGYDYYKYDNLGDGKDVTLNEGDKVLLAGKNIKVVFSPAS